jgi:hypothetical protein
MAFVVCAVLLETCVGEVDISDEMKSEVRTVLIVPNEDDTVESD